MSAVVAFPDHAFVYVIGDPQGPQKIGMSFNPSKRLIGIQTNNSGTLVIASATSVPWPLVREVERFAHWLLREQHARGEWFSVSPEAALDAVKQATQAVTLGDRAPEIRFGGPGRPFLSKTEKTVTTTIRLPEGLLMRIKALVGDRGMAKFAREAFEAKLTANGEPK